MRPLLFLLLSAALPAGAAAATIDDWMRGGFKDVDIRAIPRSVVPAPAQTKAFLDLTIVLLRGGAWTPESAEQSVREAAGVLGQCGLAVGRADLALVDPPGGRREWGRFGGGALSVAALRSAVPVSGELVVFLTGRFTDDDDAGFSRAEWTDGRDLEPALYDTVYLSEKALSPGYRAENAASPYSLLAHEILHVLTRRGRHLGLPEPNLMNNTWTGRSDRILPEHCAAALSNPLARPR